MNGTVSKTVSEKERPSVSKMNFDSAAVSKGPSADYEMARRQLRRNVNELRLLAEATLKRSSRLAELVEKYSEEMKDKLSKEDGWKEWRVDESLRLTHLAQERISKTQNPPNCSKAKKLVCHLNYACGFGCQVVFRCFLGPRGPLGIPLSVRPSVRPLVPLT